MRFGGRQSVPIGGFGGNALLRQYRPAVPIQQAMPQQQMQPQMGNFPQKMPYQPFNNMLFQGMTPQSGWRNPLLQFLGMRFR